MGRRYQQQSSKECGASFRVVEIYVARQNADGSRKNCFRFLLVDNRRETLETVQMNMHDFVRNAILANKIGNADINKMENVSPALSATAEKSCAPIQ